MGSVKNKNTGEEVEVADGAKILDACEDLGVAFGCQDGMCGVCAVDVAEGEENLEPKNSKENDVLGDAAGQRLACQCVLKSGTVVLDY